MPKTTINEVDNSRYAPSYTQAPMTVLVPGTASFGPIAALENSILVPFSGGESITDFYSKFGTSPARYVSPGTNALLGVTGDNSFEYASNLIRSGAKVLFVRLNQGSYASCPIGDSGFDIQAKYTGRFGNNIACRFEKYSRFDARDLNKTDLYVSIYISSHEFSDSNVANANTIAKWTPIFFTRVSSDPSSKYYVTSDTDLEYITLTPKLVDTIIAEIGENKELIVNLAGGLDFAKRQVTGDSIEYTPMTDEKAILADLAIRLAGPAPEDDSSSDIASVYDLVNDPYLFDFDFVTSGGICPATDGEMKAVHEKMISLCETRGDCTALLDTPESYTYKQVITYADNINTSYAAMYAPWCSFTSLSTGRLLFMPPSLIFLKAVLYNMVSSTDPQIWYVPAGVNRTFAPFIVEPKYDIGSVILDEFQNKNEYKVNPIMKVRNYGYCIYGNSTAKHEVSALSHSALESMNVRLIANVVKKYIFNVCCGLSFEYNNSELWLKFYTQMDEKLLFMKRNYGLYDYKIVMDNSTVTQEAMNERRVPGKVMISPTLAGEFFDIDFEISPAGVYFGEEE